MRHRIPAAAVLAAFLAACVPPPPGVVYVHASPPRDRVEVVAVAPGPGYVWIAGYHTWRGGAYVWVPGRWERPPQPQYHRWVPGRWKETHHGWYWVEGHWK